jgi:hypothetical protein
MAGWFDDEVTGSYCVQFMLEHSKKEQQFRIQLDSRAQHAQEAVMSVKDLKQATKKTQKPRHSGTVLPPRKRSQRDIANPVISAKTRKNYAGSRWDKGRYHTEEKETNFSPRQQRAAGSFLFNAQVSPLKKDQPVTPATPAQPITPATPAQHVLSQSQPTVLPAPQKRRGPKKKKKKKKRAGRGAC